jgi:hypothetical protein
MPSKLKCILTAKFRKTLYDNMWGFMNLDVIQSLMTSMGCNINYTTHPNIHDDNFNKIHKNSICFKGTYENGHYVYVDNKREAYGSYEKGILSRDDDDGICHGVAMIYALAKNGCILEETFTLIDYPKNDNEFRQNYKTILNFYIFIIQKGFWDIAMENNFYEDINWVKNKNKITSEQSIKSLIALKEYIPRFDIEENICPFEISLPPVVTKPSSTIVKSKRKIK